MSENKLCKSFWLRGVLCTKSPMLIGNGQQENTDNDLLLDGDRIPFIPGTSLAGVIRNGIREAEGLPKSALAQLFGDDTAQHRQSMVIFHDAPLKNKARISIRNGIELNEDTKTAKNKSKYDFEVLDPGAEFEFRMEILIREKFAALPFLQFVSNFLSFAEEGNLRIGTRTTRGYGQLLLKNVCFRNLELKTAADMQAYLDFRWENMTGTKTELLPVSTYVNPYTRITIPLRVESTLLIRNYFLNTYDVDCEQLCVNRKAAIPGSAWAGVFRHKAVEFLKELSPEIANAWIQELFGQEKEDVAKKKSRIIFEEIYEDVPKNKEGSVLRELSRTKIDRFTGSVCKGALFFERVSVGGVFPLTIWIKDAQAYEIGLILLVAEEVGNGLAAVGGATAAGRGTMRWCGKPLLDGIPLTENEIQNYWDALSRKLTGEGNAENVL